VSILISNFVKESADLVKRDRK